jgi:hypothetical protein
MSLNQISRKDFIKSFTSAINKPKALGRMQPRDYEILKFILEQKFCSLEAIYFRFFDVRLSERPAAKKLLDHPAAPGKTSIAGVNKNGEGFFHRAGAVSAYADWLAGDHNSR